LLQINRLELPEILLITPATFHDDRGYFRQTWNADQYADAGMTGPFLQDNLSISKSGVVRGLHLQNPNLQSKLVSCPQGAIFDVAVDVRVGSPRFGGWVGARLSADGGEQLFVPRGFAHGFCVIEGPALVAYKVDGPYDPSAEKTVLWNDPAIGIEWPEGGWGPDGPVLSEGDRHGTPLADMPSGDLPVYEGGG